MDVIELRFPPGDEIPNNPDLPVLAYSGVHGLEDPEGLVATNGWGGTWRSQVFTFHHFHSVSHEALAVLSGRATLVLGGPQGQEVEVGEGDALVLPAGTGHKRIDSSGDFQVMGAYPSGQEDYDMRRGDPAELEEVKANIAAVALPPADPFGGPLLERWR